MRRAEERAPSFHLGSPLSHCAGQSAKPSSRARRLQYEEVGARLLLLRRLLLVG